MTFNFFYFIICEPNLWHLVVLVTNHKTLFHYPDFQFLGFFNVLFPEGRNPKQPHFIVDSKTTGGQEHIHHRTSTEVLSYPSLKVSGSLAYKITMVKRLPHLTLTESCSESLFAHLA